MSTQTSAVSTELDALRTVFGADLANLVDFVADLKYNPTSAHWVWQPGEDGLAALDVVTALYRPGWFDDGRTLPSVLIDQGSNTFYMSRSEWLAVSAIAHTAASHYDYTNNYEGWGMVYRDLAMGLDSMTETAPGSGVMCFSAVGKTYFNHFATALPVTTFTGYLENRFYYGQNAFVTSPSTISAPSSERELRSGCF